MEQHDTGADSVSTTPRSHSDDKQPLVRLMVSFGGKIIPRPHDNQLRYVGGDTRIIAVPRSTTFSLLLSKLSTLLSPPPPSSPFSVKYQLPNEELDALITVSTDEDVDNMMDEFDRLSLSSNPTKIPRLRLFLFPPVEGEGGQISRSSSIASLLDGSKKRESWFLDALNGGATLERGRSEASSIVSEVPDYLFGFDTNSDDMGQPPPPLPPPVKFRTRSGLGEVSAGPGSDPGSPAFGSGSSAPSMPNLPPVKTKPPEKSGMNPGEEMGGGGGGGGVVWGPGSPYTGGQPVPVYYVPATGSGPGMAGQANVVPVQGQYVPQYGPGPVHVQVGYPGMGSGSGSGPVYEVPMQGNINMVPGQGVNVMNQQQQPMYYGVKNGGMVASYPGMGMGMGMSTGAGMGMGMGMGMPVSGDDQDGSNIRTHHQG